MIFFFNDTATTEIYTLSLHDALPISRAVATWFKDEERGTVTAGCLTGARLGQALIGLDRKSTRLNSSHLVISYAVFCLKQKSAHATHSRPLRWSRATA